MTIEQLIQELQKYPGHYTVDVMSLGYGESSDLTAEIQDVQLYGEAKIVSLEIGPLT